MGNGNVRRCGICTSYLDPNHIIMGKSIFYKHNLLKRNEKVRRKKCIYIALAVIIAVAVFMLAISSVK
jgi:hypothetical protein